jgi:hypothetical protein
MNALKGGVVVSVKDGLDQGFMTLAHDLPEGLLCSLRRFLRRKIAQKKSTDA